MRFFIALEIPPESKQQLVELQHQLKEIIPELKLTTDQKFHLTYAFVGDHPAEIKDSLINVLEKSVQGVAPFNLAPGYLDGFPNIHNPRVLWVGVKGDIDKLLILRERIKDGLHILHLDTDERRFVPHITIAKNREFSVTPEIESKLQSLMNKDFMPIHVTSVKLFESVANEGFHQHNTLAEVTLQPQSGPTNLD
jgi:RNA 2',3'-cyclic 3'-phosphodiesterase